MYMAGIGKMKFYNSTKFRLLLVLFATTISIANTDSEEGLLFDGYMLGTTIRQLEAGDILIADIPLIEARIPLKTNAVQFKYGGNLMWGLTQFFVEWNYAAGLIVYPFGKFLGLSATGRLGSFFLDNISYTGAVGVHFDIPLDENRLVTIGTEYFYRNSKYLLDYVSFAGKKTFNSQSHGVGVSIGLML